jgi:septum formation protein
VNQLIASPLYTTMDLSNRLILASGSPRRIELLHYITRDFIAIKSGVQEEGVDDPCDPRDRVVILAKRKAEAVAAQGYRGIIIGADTMVLIDSKTFGKPTTRSEAHHMLTRLSNREHIVITGLYLFATETGKERQAVVGTTVTFRKLSPAEIEFYLDEEEYRGKAGAYSIEGKAALFIERIEGDYYNVLGLPLCQLQLLLNELR